MAEDIEAGHVLVRQTRAEKFQPEIDPIAPSMADELVSKARNGVDRLEIGSTTSPDGMSVLPSKADMCSAVGDVR